MATRPRLAVLSVLRELGGHHSVDGLVALLGHRGMRVTRMTVYNVVAALWEAGLLMRADAGPGRALYEAGDIWHHHFVCRRCGEVFDLPCVVGGKPCIEVTSERIGRLDEAQIIFRGLCSQCAAAAPANVAAMR